MYYDFFDGLEKLIFIAMAIIFLLGIGCGLLIAWIF